MQTSVPQYKSELAGAPGAGGNGPLAAAGFAPGSLFLRMLAYGVDLFVVGTLIVILAFALFVLGFLSFGASWFLIAPVCAAVPAIYSGLTLSSPSQATLGMRLFGLRLRTVEGGSIDFLTGAGHALLFYIFGTTMTPLILLVGLFRHDGALLHDLVLRVRLVSRRYH
ncbi:MAG: RDD family protein [Hyphomicrobiales bacterium]|nr:RDD family protein [Hyphomicrobiales bacterium]